MLITSVGVGSEGGGGGGEESGGLGKQDLVVPRQVAVLHGTSLENFL